MKTEEGYYLVETDNLQKNPWLELYNILKFELKELKKIEKSYKERMRHVQKDIYILLDNLVVCEKHIKKTDKN